MVKLVLPRELADLAGGRAIVELDVNGTGGTSAPSVREALSALRSAYPHVYERLITERGDLRPHVNAFVGGEDVRRARGLDTPVPADREIVILRSVSGG